MAEEKLGEWLKRMMAERDVTITDLKNAARVEWPAAQAWLEKDAEPSGSSAAAIARTLRLTPTEREKFDALLMAMPKRVVKKKAKPNQAAQLVGGEIAIIKAAAAKKRGRPPLARKAK